MMKKLILILALLIPLAASAARPKSVSRTEITSIISDFRHYDGVEVVRLAAWRPVP